MPLLLGAVKYRTFNANFYHLFMNGYLSKWDLWRSHVVQVKYESIVNRKCSGNVSRQGNCCIYTFKDIFWGYKVTCFYFRKEKANSTLKKSDNFFFCFEVLPSLWLIFVQTNEKYKERFMQKENVNKVVDK